MTPVQICLTLVYTVFAFIGVAFLIMTGYAVPTFAIITITLIISAMDWLGYFEGSENER